MELPELTTATLRSAAGKDDPFAGWDTTPLFMQALPSDGALNDASGANTGQNTLAALQALAYDGSPSEIAEEFRNQGNQLFKQRKFKDAIGFYSRALDELGQDLSVEEKRTLWSNRAAANLELANYGSCLRDVAQVLGAPQTYYPEPMPEAWKRTDAKALLRSARALLGLDRLDEAFDALLRLQVLEERLGEAQLDSGKKWREQVQTKIQQRERLELGKKEKERRRKEEEQALVLAMTLRGVALPKITASKPLFSECPSDVRPPHFDPKSLPSSSSPSIPLLPPKADSEASSAAAIRWTAPPPETSLIFPIFLMMPLNNPPTRDLCLEFHTAATFGDLLASMDQDPTTIAMYIATKEGRVLKVGNKLTLGKVLVAAAGEAADDGWELKEGWALELVAVPKGPRGEEWVAKWKQEVKAGVKPLM
ncbi:BZ3500_MvSof-1268-A1-R1_Chr2-1g04506 [Microbotryum saponariae]|uniref:BZ3500_MvSof-1268-A1-R1_Chr2-1g04506 protein n=1 Tax=Microbotryum saponariae TaxID=289078 RepID=A0A2X0MA25_9BASI|nr:BZ3500_MvSof-1268-A1-R1_Chr2-1g04506 [Microbotryum saponariae]SCZ91870.1 BZ3501_MvSof-1269-A2-R1_Chr2-1g04162 [Microbotryum saponariae]